MQPVLAINGKRPRNKRKSREFKSQVGFFSYFGPKLHNTKFSHRKSSIKSPGGGGGGGYLFKKKKFAIVMMETAPSQSDSKTVLF